jgi:hypothetical protein
MANDTPRKPTLGGLTSGSRDATRRSQTFSASEQREDAFRAELARQKRESDAKTAKLKALRLAKEEEERIAAANAPPKPARASRSKKSA